MTADRTASGARKISQGVRVFCVPLEYVLPPGEFPDTPPASRKMDL